MYVSSDRTPTVQGSYHEVTNKSKDDSFFNIILDNRSNYRITHGPDTFKGKYVRSKGHSFILRNQGSTVGYVILTEKNAYVIFPKVSSKPILVKKHASIFDNNGQTN